MKAFSIRTATANDAEAIAALTGELGFPAGADVMRSRIRAVLDSPMDILRVAVDASGAPVAWLHAHSAHLIESGFRVEVLGLVVSSGARRSGIGRRLVADAERWAASIDASAIVVRSHVKREESHIFYRAIGYELAKTQQVYRKAL